MQVSALRGFVGGSSFPSFGPEGVSPQMSCCSSYRSLQLLRVTTADGAGQSQTQALWQCLWDDNLQQQGSNKQAGTVQQLLPPRTASWDRRRYGKLTRQEIGLGLSGRYLSTGDNSLHTFSSDICQMQTFQVKATWHKSQLLFSVNPPSLVHPNKGALSHFLAPAAGLCFTAYVYPQPHLDRPCREQGQAEADSRLLSRPQLRPLGPGRARGNGATCWRRCAPQDPPAAAERDGSRHHVPVAAARPAAQGECQPRHVLAGRTQPESSLEVPWGSLGSEEPRGKAHGSGRLCSVLVQLPALCWDRSCEAERRVNRWSLIHAAENLAEPSRWDRALW